MESAKMAQLASMAAEYRRQLSKVDRKLQKAKLFADEPRKDKSQPRKPSPSPISSKKPRKKKKAKVSKTIEGPGRPERRSQTPTRPLPSKSSGLKKSLMTQGLDKDEKSKWKAEYLPLIQNYLIETYSPYEKMICELKTQLSLIESDAKNLDDQAVFIKTSVDSLGPGLGIKPPSLEVRVPTFGVPQSHERLDGASNQHQTMAEIEILEAKNAQLNQRLVELKGKSRTSEGHRLMPDRIQDDEDAGQDEVDQLRAQAAHYDTLLANTTEELRLREELHQEQELVKGLAGHLQNCEDERKRLYSKLEDLKRSLSQFHDDKSQDGDQREVNQREATMKLENLKQMNVELATQGRDLHERIKMLNKIESDLQEYHEGFCQQVNNPAQTDTQNLYTIYLSFLVEGYKHFLQQLIETEIRNQSDLLGTSIDHEPNSQYGNSGQPSNEPFSHFLYQPQ